MIKASSGKVYLINWLVYRTCIVMYYQELIKFFIGMQFIIFLYR